MKNVNKHFFLLILVFIPFVVISQIKINKNFIYSFDSLDYKTNTLNNETFAKNAVHFELLGNGLIYSLGYERIFIHKQKHKLFGNFGFSYWKNDYDYALSSQIGYLYGCKRKFEFGFGYSLLLTYEDHPYVVENPQFLYDHLFFLRIGYRYQKAEEGIFYKAAFTPFHYKDSGFLPLIMPWIGIAIGYTF